jgi:hypothetical protein
LRPPRDEDQLKKKYILSVNLLLFLQGLDERLPRSAQGEAILYFHVARMDLSLCPFPDDPIHASGFLG